MTRPDIQIPKEFAINGEKADFTQEKIQNGFDDKNPDIFAGDNANKFIDDTYKGLNGVLDLYNGVVLHEMTTTYNDKAVVGKFIENNFKLYRSKQNDNTGHEVTESNYWEEVALGGGGSGFSLFDTRTLDYELPFEQSEGWALQGTYVYKEGVTGSRYGYPDFYAECISQKNNATATETTLGNNTITMYINGNGHQFYDIADKDVVDNFYNSVGVAWFYGIDTENERIFLPRNDYFDQLTGDVTQVGKFIEAGLPNITGTAGIVTRNNTGALALTPSFSNREYGAGANGGSGLGLDASLSSPVYGKSDTVQPNAVKKLLYICVGNANVETAVTNITEITTSENDTLPLFYNFYSKEDMTTTGAYVNASLGTFLSGNVYKTAYNELVKKLGTGNVKSITDDYTDYDFVVNQDEISFRLPLLNGKRVLVEKKEATADDTTWYNLYNDGWCEQGGQDVSDKVINLYKSYKDTSYNLVVTWRNASSITYPITDTAKTVSSFNTTSKSGNGTIYWQTEGYTDIPTNTGVNLYYKVANAVENLEILDVAKVMKEAVLRSSLEQCNVVTETYSNGASWYRVYSDGWCEQGGITSKGTNIVINLLKPYTNTKYVALISQIYTGSTDMYGTVKQDTKTSTGFTIIGHANLSFEWEAKGYIS